MTEAFVVIDLETTGLEPANADIVEWAAIVIRPPWFDGGSFEEVSALVKPPVPIPAETSAVHHIIDADVKDAPAWSEQSSQVIALLDQKGRIAVAHNAEYEKAVLAKHGIPLVPAWLCTYKAACRIWPGAPGLSNEVLRYWLGLGTGRTGHQQPHSALHDARVTAQILSELLRVGASIEDMLKWTTEPALLPTCPLGDWRGKKWGEVDEGFLMWIVRKIQDRPDVVFCARTELDRRERERRAAASATTNAEDDVPF